MGSIRHPSPELFVVRPLPDAPEVATAQLTSLGEVDEVHAGAQVWRVKIGDGTTDPHEGWARLRSRISRAPCREKVFAEPVLIDECGGQHLPTGEVTVRFVDTPSEDALGAFALAHGLKLRERNPYVQEQVVFLLSDPSSTYLPGVVDALRAQRGVKAAWANTLSEFRKTAA